MGAGGGPAPSSHHRPTRTPPALSDRDHENDIQQCSEHLDDHTEQQEVPGRCPILAAWSAPTLQAVMLALRGVRTGERRGGAGQDFG
jgi:hypothetical protein